MAVTNDELKIKVTINTKDGEKVVDLTKDFKELAKQYKENEKAADQYAKKQKENLSSLEKQNDRLKLQIENFNKSEVDRIKNTLKFTEKELKKKMELAEANSDVAKSLQERLNLERKFAGMKIADIIDKTNEKLGKQELLLKKSDQEENIKKSVEAFNKKQRALDRVNNSAEKSNSVFTRLGARFISVNQGLELLQKGFLLLQKTVNFTIGNFREFEKGLVGVVKTANLTEDQTMRLSEEVLKMSETIPASTKELFEIAKAAGQLGVEANQLTNFTETIVRLGSASDVAGEEAAMAASRILGLTRTPTSEIDEFASALVALGNNMRANEGEILRTTNVIAQGIGHYRASADAVLALGAASRDLGIRFELAGSAMSRTFIEITENINKGGEQLKKLALLTGMTGEELKKAFDKDSVGTFRRFLSGLNQISKVDPKAVTAGLAQLGLVGVEINRVLPTLAQNIDRVDRAFFLASTEMKFATALMSESERAFETLDSKIIILDNATNNLGTRLGVVFAPAIKAATISATKFVQSLANLVRKLEPVSNALAEIVHGLESLDFQTATYHILAFTAAVTSMIVIMKGAGSVLAFGAIAGPGVVVLASIAAGLIKISSLISGLILLAGKLTIFVVGVTAIYTAIINLGNIFEYVWVKIKSLIADAADAFFDFLGLFKDVPETNFAGVIEEDLKKVKDSFDLSPVDFFLEKLAQMTTSVQILKPTAEQTSKAIDSLAKKKAMAQTAEEAEKWQQSINKFMEYLQEAAQLSNEELVRQKEILSDLAFQNERLSTAIQNLGASESDIIKNNLKLQLEEIKNQEQKIRLSGLWNKEIQAELDKRKELVKTQADQKLFEIVIKKQKEHNKLVDDLKERYANIRKETSLIGKTQEEQISINAQADIDEINKQIAKLNIEGDINGEKRKQLELIRKAIAEQAQAKIDQIRLEKEKKIREEMQKTFEQTKLANQQLAVSISNIGATQEQVIDNNLKLKLKELDLEYKKIEAMGEVPAALKQEFELRRSLLGLQAEANKEELERQKRDAVSAFSRSDVTQLEYTLGPEFANIASSITDLTIGATSFASGASAFIAGMQALVDMGPQLIDSVTNLLNSITNLPQVLIESLDGLISAVFSFFSSFIPNVISALPKIFSQILVELPRAIQQGIFVLFDSLPSLIDEFLSQLPFLVQEIVSTFISFIPMLVARLVSFLIREAPKIALQLTKVLAIELPIAIIEGVLEGLKLVGKSIAGIFTGDFDFGLPKEQIQKDLEDVLRNVSGVGDQLFQVKDLAEEEKGEDTATKIRKAIVSSAAKAGDIITRVWNWVKSLIENVMTWIRDKIFTPLFTWVADKIFKPIGAAIEAVFRWVFDKIFHPIISLFYKLFEWVGQIIFTAMDGVKAGFDLIFETFNHIVENLTSAFTGLMGFFGEIGTTIWEGLKAAFDFQWISDGITKLFTDLNLDFLTDMFKLPDSAWGKGTVEDTLGVDIPFLKFAEGGLVPGTGNKDTVPAMLTPGEVVLPKDVVKLFQEAGLIQNFAFGGVVKTFKDIAGKIDPIEGAKDILFGKLSDMFFNMLRANRFQNGGLVGTDSVPSLLTPGEFVINRPAVQQLGTPILEGLNKGKMPRGDTNIEVNIKIDSRQEINDDFIRNRMMPTMKRELKRASLDGEFVISRRGIRQ